MNINNGSLGYSLDLNNEQFNKMLKQSMQKINNFSASSIREINNINLSVKDLAAGIGIAFGVNEAKNFIQQMVKVRGEFQQTEIAFNTMLQSQDKSKKLMAEMVELAKNTPMQFSEVSQGAKQLLAYQVEAENLTDTLTMLGNISSGLSVPLSRLILVYGQVRAKGKLMGDDLRQFTEAGVPMIAEIAKNMGIAQSEVANMVSEGKVGFKEVEQVLKNLTSQGGLFFNMMEEQSKTIPGQIAKLQDELEQMFNQLGKDAQPMIEDVVSGASLIVENYKEIGSVLTSLIATYGTYKAATIVMTTANASFISSMDKIERYGDLGAKRLIVSYNQAKATLNEAKAQEKLSVTQLASARTTKNLADEANKKALTELNSAHALKKAADEEVLAAQKKYDAYKGSHFVKKENQALTELEIAKEKQLTAVKNVSTASTNTNTTSEKVNTANKNLAVAATERETAKKAVAAATTNLETAATNRLTFAQRMNVAWTELATLATNAWNASLLSNPIVLVVAAIAGLTTAYFLLRDTTDEAEKAQDRFNKTQEKVKTAVENTKKKAEEYISVLKDETATVYQQIKAYEALQSLRLKSLKDLSQEQIQKMDLEEINKRLNQSMDSTGLTAQKNELKKIEQTIADVNSQMNKYDKSTASGSYAIQKLQKQLDVLNIQYDTQFKLIEKIDEEQKMANMTLDQKRAYWENVISATEQQINTINQANNKQTEGKTILGVNLDLVNQTGTAFQMWNVNPLISQLEQAKTELLKINTAVGSEVKVSKNKSFWEQQKKEASDARDALAYTQKGSKEWNELTKKINEANTALQSYNDSYQKPKAVKTKSTKKSDDPLEKFKKEVEQYKEQYDKIQKYSDTTDKWLNVQANQLTKILEINGKPATYVEFLRQQQEELSKTAKTSEITAKKLSVINSELYPLLNDSLIENYKKDFEKQLELSDTLIEKVELIKKAKAELEGKTDENSKIKLQFIDEKSLQNQANIDSYLKDANRKFEKQYQFLTTMRKEYDADMLLHQEQYNKASNDAEKKRIQDLMLMRSKQYTEDTDGKSESSNVNRILNEYKSLEQKRKDIAAKYSKDIEDTQTELSKETDSKKIALYTDTIAEIQRQQTEALNAVDKEILEKSEGWIQIFGDYANKSSDEILNMMNAIRSKLADPNNGLSPEQLKAYQDQLEKLKDFISKEDPFAYLYDSFTNFQDLFKDGKFNFDGLRLKIQQLKVSVDGVFDIVDGLGINISEASKETVKLGLDLFEAGSNIAQGVIQGKPLQVVKGIVGGITSIINAGDRKKERQIQKYKAAVDELSKSFNQLQIATDKALGRDVYKNQQQMINNLNQQNAEIDKMIKKEKDKKKTDNNKIKEWEQQKIDNLNRSKEIMESITQDILQTNAKDLASTLGDALVEAFGRGEDAALSFEKVANDVLKNAVLNQLKKSFLEKDLQPILDNLQSQMGVTENGWNGLTKTQQDQFRSEIERVSKNFNGALGSYADLFKDLGAAVEEEEKGLSGAFKGMSEEAANLLSGQMNAIRINMSQMLEIYSNSNAILVQQLDQLFRIEFNTRNITPTLERIYNKLDNNSRAFGL